MAADDVINRSKLQVCYPFGEGTSANLVECVDKLSHKKENTELKNEILGLKDDVFGMSDAELENGGFTREEILQGLADMADRFGVVLPLSV